MPHRKYTVETIENVDLKKRSQLAKSAWFQSAMRLTRLKEWLERLQFPSTKNQMVQVPIYWNIENLKSAIEMQQIRVDKFYQLWKKYSSKF